MDTTVTSIEIDILTDYYEKGHSVTITDTRNSAVGASVPSKRLKLLGSVHCAARTAARALLDDVQICDEAGISYVAERPDLNCDFLAAITRYIRDEFESKPAITELKFEFGLKVPVSLMNIAEQLGVEEIAWPLDFAVHIIRTEGTITVTYDDWSQNLSMVGIYEARLL